MFRGSLFDELLFLFCFSFRLAISGSPEELEGSTVCRSQKERPEEKDERARERRSNAKERGEEKRERGGSKVVGWAREVDEKGEGQIRRTGVQRRGNTESCVSLQVDLGPRLSADVRVSRCCGTHSETTEKGVACCRQAARDKKHKSCTHTHTIHCKPVRQV